MTTPLRKAIVDMRKRGYNGEQIIHIAKAAAKWGKHDTASGALIRYVEVVKPVCKACEAAGHHSQNCTQIRAMMKGGF